MSRPFRHRRFLTKWTITAAALIGGGYLIAFSPLFNIRVLAVRGSRAVSEEAVTAAARNVARGRRWYIFPEQNLFFFSAAELRQNLSGNPYLKNLTVNRRVPGTLIVNISERTATALWKSRQRWFAIDDQGQVLGEVSSPTPTATRPVLTNSATLEDPQAGERVIAGNALELARRLKESLGSLSGFHVALFDTAKLAQGTITAVTDTGLLIYFNAAADLPAQVSKLQIFAAEKERANANWQRGLHYLDLRFGETRVYYR